MTSISRILKGKNVFTQKGLRKFVIKKNPPFFSEYAVVKKKERDQ